MKKLLIIIGLLFVTMGLAAQSLLKPIDDLPFARLQRNHIVFPDDSLVLDAFFTKMDSVVNYGKGHLSILHLGDSHIQAGISTQALRDNLLTLAPDLMGGQFLAFPYSAGKTNNPAYYIVNSTGEWKYCRNAVIRPEDKRMGLAGAAVSTSDPNATITIVSRERNLTAMSPSFQFNKVTLLGYVESGRVTPAVSHRGTRLKGSYDETQSAYVFDLPFLTDTVCICFDTMRGTFALTGVLLENGQGGISLQGVGVNGAKVSSYLRCDDFERDLRLIHPDLVILAIGTNDALDSSFNKAEFKRNYAELIGIIRRVNPDCALLFVTNNDCFHRYKTKKKVTYKVNPNGPIAEQAFMEMAKEHHAAVWNLYDIMGGLKSMQAWQKAGLAQKDRLHFTKEGYELMGDLMYNALMECYIQHLKANTSKH